MAQNLPKKKNIKYNFTEKSWVFGISSETFKNLPYLPIFPGNFLNK